MHYFLGNFISRQLKTWTRQYKSSETQEIKHMNLLIDWLPKYVGKIDTKQTVVHGDYRFEFLNLLESFIITLQLMLTLNLS